MKIINKAKTNNTVSYFYSFKMARFEIDEDGYNFGFNPDVEIIVDVGLFANELDAIFAEVL